MVQIELKSARFKDESMEAFFNRYGFAYIPDFIEEEVLSTLRNEFYKIHLADHSKNQWNSQYDLNHVEADRVSTLIKEHIQEAFVKTFDDFELPIATIMSKNPIPQSTCELHRDFTVFDENKVQFRNFWIPLIDITKDNGALYAIPGSHQVYTDIRPMFANWNYEDQKEELLKYKKDFFVKAGDLVLYADKTLHGSFENKTSEPRPVLHGGILPLENSIYYNKLEYNRIKRYKVSNDFFMRGEFMDDDKMQNYPLVEEFDYVPKEIKLHQAIAHIAPLFKELST